MGVTKTNTLVLDRIKPGVPILCKSEKEAEQLCSALDDAGFIWKNGDRLKDYTNWEYRGCEGIYYFLHEHRDVTFATTSMNHIAFNEVMHNEDQYQAGSLIDKINPDRLMRNVPVVCTTREQFIALTSALMKKFNCLWTIDESSGEVWDKYFTHGLSAMWAVVRKPCDSNRAIYFGSDRDYANERYGVVVSFEKICYRPDDIEKHIDDVEESDSIGDPDPVCEDNTDSQPTADTGVSYIIKKENKTMNNMFGLNIECGAITDENIASSILGVAVKVNDSWRIYDKENHTMTDLGNMNIESLPLWIIPTADLAEGDLIKHDGEYYYVAEGPDSDDSTDTVMMVSASTGKVTEIVPMTNLLGLRLYSKVFTITDEFLSDTDDGMSDFALAMLMMNSQKHPVESADGNPVSVQNQMMSWLPLLLMLKDKKETVSDPADIVEKKKDNKFKKLAMFSMMMGGGEQPQSNNDAMMQMFLMKKLGVLDI